MGSLNPGPCLQRRALTMLAAILAVTWTCAKPPVAPATTPAELGRFADRHLGAYRPWHGRLSIDLDYAQCVPASTQQVLEPCRAPSPGPLSTAKRLLLRDAERYSSMALDDATDSQALHVRALWILLGGDEARLTEAAQLLETALLDSPNEAALHNDLAVVYLAQVARGQQSQLPRALDHAQAAVRWSVPGVPGAQAPTPRRSIAQFNAGLAASAVPLIQTARATWHALLATHGESKIWNEEARKRLSELVETNRDAEIVRRLEKPLGSARAASALVRARPDQAYVYLFESLMPRWARTVEATGEDDSEIQTELRWFATALRNVLGDQTGEELLNVLARTADRNERCRYARGFLAYARGRSQLAENRIAEAKRAFSLAEWNDPNDNGPLARWSRVWLALIGVYTGDHGAAEDLLDQTERGIELAHVPMLAGRVLWHRGLSWTRQGQDALSVASFRQAEALFGSLADSRSAAAIQLMLGDDLDALGRPDRGWETRLNAVRTLSEYPDSVAFHNVLVTSADACQSQGWIDAGLAFAAEAVAQASRSEDPISRVEAGQRLGALLAKAGRLIQARVAFDRALEESTTITEPIFRESVRAEVRLERATLGSAADAASELDALYDYYLRRRHTNRLLAVLLGRARRARRQGDLQIAVRDLEESISRLLDKNRTLQGVGDRLAHAHVIGEIFAELIGQHADKGNAFESLALTTCARLAPYRSLQEPGRGHLLEGSCTDLKDVLRTRLRALPTDERWIVYLSLPKRTLIWEIENRTVALHVEHLSRPALDRKIQRFRHAIVDGRKDRMEAASAALWESLKLGDESDQPPAKVVIAPDGVLERLSFGALIDPRSGRYLIDRQPIEISVGDLFQKRMTADDFPQVSAKPLVVADPAFDRGLWNLDRLPGARNEASIIAAAVGSPTPLVGTSATRERLLDALTEATLFHFAGHAVSLIDDPFDSYLLLADDNISPASQQLTAESLFHQDLSRLRLVVLSACQTATGGRLRTSPASSLAGLAMPFLIRSQAQVVASLEVVEDHAVSTLMQRFYSHLAAGAPVAQALRLAQLDLLGGADNVSKAPRAWSSFVVLR